MFCRVAHAEPVQIPFRHRAVVRGNGRRALRAFRMVRAGAEGSHSVPSAAQDSAAIAGAGMTVAQRTLAALLLVPLAAGPLAAQDAWNPFRDKDEKAKAQRGPVISGTNPQLSSPRGAPLPTVEAGELAPPAWGTKEQAVDRGELQPVLANDSSGLPLELWQGLDMNTLERHVAQLGRTVPSYALQGVWRRVWMSSAPPPGGGRDSGHFLALK